MATSYCTSYPHRCIQCGKRLRPQRRNCATGLCRACWREHPEHLPTLERFWRHVDRHRACSCHTWEDRCWPWTAYCDPQSGYGKFGLKGKVLFAHRFIYQATHGDLPTQVYVLHQPPCIVRACVRHLYAGSQKDNVRDTKLMQRDRQGAVYYGKDHACIRHGYINSPRGERNPLAKLTRRKVIAIRDASQRGISGRALARKYHVDKSTIQRILHGVTWKHLPVIPATPSFEP